MKVCLVAPYPPYKSGVADYTNWLVQALSSHADIHVITHQVDGAPSDEHADGVHVHRIWNPGSIFAPIRVVREIRRICPDIVHLQFGAYGKEYGGVIGEPMLVLVLLLKMMRMPCIITLHSLWTREELRKRGRERSGRTSGGLVAELSFGLLIKNLIRPVDLMLLSVLDDSTMSKFASEYELDIKRLAPTYHGVYKWDGREKLDARRSLGLPEDAFIYLCFGFIYEDKGIEDAISALASLQSGYLAIVGPPLEDRGAAYVEKLRGQIESKGPQGRVRLSAEFVPESVARDYFDACDVVLLPYRRVVGTSGVIHRAIAHARPVIAYDTGWHRLENECVSYAQHPETASLAQTMDALGKDPERRARMGMAARELAKARTWSKIAKDTYDLYLRLNKGGE